MKTLLVTCVGILSYPVAVCVGLSRLATHLADGEVPFDREDGDAQAYFPVKGWVSQPFDQSLAA